MRRTDREITDSSEIQNIIQSCEICYLAMSKDSEPYVVPMNFGIRENCLYFHCANQGKKLEFIGSNPNVSIAFTSQHQLQLEGEPRNWTTRYRSAIVKGTAEIITDPAGKQQGIDILLKQYSEIDQNIPLDQLKNVTIIKVKINKMAGKANWH